jgi:putative two-component system response regulator
VVTAQRQTVKDGHVLIADDEAENVVLLERLLEASGFSNVVTTTDSTKVVELCTSIDPDLIVLDLQMPEPDGFEVMDRLSPWIHGPMKLPVLVTTDDSSPETKRRALGAGARDFLTKPLDPSEVMVRIENTLESRLLGIELREQAEALEQAVQERTHEPTEAAREVIEPLAVAAAYRDDEDAEHALRVGRTSGLLGQGLGLDEETAEMIGQAARLHDIGKIGLSDDVLLQAGRHTPEDLELLKNHVALGAEILGRGRTRLMKMAAEIARTHHELWDGSGYPRGLSGEQIPMSGRIVGLADAFDILLQPHAHSGRRRLPEAVSEIQGLAGSSFDPRVVDAFDALHHAALVGPAGLYAEVEHAA